MEHTTDFILIPLILPFVAATLCLLFNKFKTLQHAISAMSGIALMVVCLYILLAVENGGIFVTQIGGWKAPFGITIVVDMFAALMLTVSAFVALMVTVYAVQNISTGKKRFGFYVFFHFLIMGVNGAFIAGDIFNLYVWFEVMLIASFVLLALGNSKDQLVATVKYTLLSFIASAVLLFGVGMIYGITGSLNMAEIAVYIRENPENPLITVAAVLFLLPFAIKSALFPVYFWLPASYPTPSISVTAIFSGLLTKVAVYALFRCFTLMFVNDVDYTHHILLVAAGFTMFSGVIGAAAMTEMRRILSFHIISQIGYMVLGLALYSPLAIAGGVFYIIHNILAKTNLFLITGVVEKIKGSGYLKKIGGIYQHFPWLSLLFLISALSLAGLPPLSGFWAKFILIEAGFAMEAYFVIFIAIVTALLTLFSMTKIWVHAFWGKDQTDGTTEFSGNERQLFRTHWKLLLPIVGMASVTLFIGLYSAPLMEFATVASDQLLNPTQYINKVLFNR